MKVANGFAELAALLQANAHDLVERTIADVRDRAKAHSRYDRSPGRENDPRPHMRDEWTHEMESDTSGTVSNPTPQAIFNEYGTRFVPAQPMIHPAMDEARPQFEAGLQHLLDG